MDTTLLEGSQFEGTTIPLGGESPWQAGDRKIYWVARAPYPITSQFGSRQRWEETSMAYPAGPLTALRFHLLDVL